MEKNPYNLYHISELSLSVSVNQSQWVLSWTCSRNTAQCKDKHELFPFSVALVCHFFLLLTFYCGKRWTAVLVLRLTPWERETQSSSASQMNITPFALLKEMNSDIPRKTAPVKRLNVYLCCRGGWPKIAHCIFSVLQWCYFIIILTQIIWLLFTLLAV